MVETLGAKERRRGKEESALEKLQLQQKGSRCKEDEKGQLRNQVSFS